MGPEALRALFQTESGGVSGSFAPPSGGPVFDFFFEKSLKKFFLKFFSIFWFGRRVGPVQSSLESQVELTGYFF